MEKLAEFKQPCADLFLHLGPEWQTDIPTTEEGEGAIAYWSESLSPDAPPSDQPPPPDQPPNPGDPLERVRLRVTAKFKDLSTMLTSHPDGVPIPMPSWVKESVMDTYDLTAPRGTAFYKKPKSLGGSWSHLDPVSNVLAYDDANFSGYETWIVEKVYIGLGVHRWDLDSWSVQELDDEGNPVDPERDNPGDNGEGNPPPPPPKKGIVVKEILSGEERIVKTIQRETKPLNAEFKCESCEQNCVLMVRTKSDGTAKGICICKDGLSEEEEKMACEKCKADLLKDLPGIITTKLKAEQFPILKKETKSEFKEELAPLVVKVLKEEVPETLDSDAYIQKHVGVDTFDADGKLIVSPPKPLTTLVGNIKDALLKNPEFLEAPSLIEAIEAVIKEQVPEVKDSIEYGKHIGILDDKGEEIKNLDPENPQAPPVPATPTLTNLVGNVKDVLLKEEGFKSSLFTGNEIASILIDSLNDEVKLKALGAKLIDAIVSVTDDAKLKTLKDKLAAPANNNDPNKLTANGFEWTITKVADKVDSVFYVAKDDDSVSALSNSGSAIITALTAKFAGKNFTLESSSSDPNTKTYTYNINEL